MPVKRRSLVGQRRHRIKIIEDQGTGRTSYGGVTESASVFAERWASIESTGEVEQQIGGQAAGLVTHKMGCLFVEGLKTSMRVEHGNRKFEIISAMDPDERKKDHMLTCREVV